MRIFRDSVPFFALDISAAGTKIRDRGDNVVNLSQNKTCLSCHQPAASFDDSVLPPGVLPVVYLLRGAERTEREDDVGRAVDAGIVASEWV